MPPASSVSARQAEAPTFEELEIVYLVQDFPALGVF